MSIHTTDLLVNFSNSLPLVSYSVRYILGLRWFAVAAALTTIPYFLSQTNILWPPVFWGLVFTLISTAGRPEGIQLHDGCSMFVAFSLNSKG